MRGLDLSVSPGAGIITELTVHQPSGSVNSDDGAEYGVAAPAFAGWKVLTKVWSSHHECRMAPDGHTVTHGNSTGPVVGLQGAQTYFRFLLCSSLTVTTMSP